MLKIFDSSPLPFSIVIQSHNRNATSSTPKTVRISLDHFLQHHPAHPPQSPFNRHARLPSLLSNCLLWLTFVFAIIVLQLEKHSMTNTIRLIYGILMLIIILTCYVFILIESRGCVEQILLKKRLQIDLVKRELALIQREPKMMQHLSVSATNYYNSLRRKFIDYQLYDRSMCQRFQSYFYHETCSIETPFHIRSCHLNIPDFIIDSTHLCQISFEFHLDIIGRDAEIVRDDIEDEFQRLQSKLSRSLNTSDSIDSDPLMKLARIHRHIHFQFQDPKHQECLIGQRRTCLTFDNRATIRGRWFLTENTFWIMTCFGLSWLFRLIFACFIRKIVVPVYVQIEGAMPLPTRKLPELN